MERAVLGRFRRWQGSGTGPRLAFVGCALLSSSVILAGFAASAPPAPAPPALPAEARGPQPAAPAPAVQPAPAPDAAPDAAPSGFWGLLPASPAATVTGYPLRPADKGAAPLRATAIPAAAAAAYQRAEAVLQGAMPACKLEWTLLAAVGQVATDHARASYDGPTLGWVLPALVGPVLTDAAGAQEPDSDGGKLDLDARFDRAVGPMGLSPQQWAQVGVDADDDGRRDALDLDDAALGAAVLLCGGSPALGDDAARTTALARLNADPAFAPRVLAVAADYRRTAAAVPAPSGPPPTIPTLPGLPSTPPAVPEDDDTLVAKAHPAPGVWGADRTPFVPFDGPDAVPWSEGPAGPPEDWKGH